MIWQVLIYYWYYNKNCNAFTPFAANVVTGDEQESARSPYFDLDNSGNVTAVLGKAAYLNCRVKNIKNQTVSVPVLYYIVKLSFQN